MARFEEVLANLGRTVGKAIDDGADAYQEASTHQVRVKQGDKTLLKISAPWGPIRDMFVEAGEGFRSLAERADAALDHVVEKIGNIKIEVTPIDKSQAAVPPAPPDPKGPDAELL